ncbi:putative ribonuclease H-like domain-containing protein [Tanacetum coccineum]
MSKGNGTRERKPTWNNVQRVNKQNQFVPLAVQTRTGINPVNTAKASGTNNFSTARQNVNRQTVLTSTALKVNTVKPIVNGVRPANVFHKTHSPSTRPFKRTTVLKTNFSNQKVYTAKDNPHRTLKNKGIIDSGCSRHMTGNKHFEEWISLGKELQPFNLFTVVTNGDKKNKVLFTDSECLVLSPDFKLPDENQILLKVPRQNNMYSFNLENIVPLGGLACLIAKATTDESNLWHRRLGHVNFKNLNRLVKGNLVRGLPTKLFQNDHTCVACQKGKQHKASCKAKVVSSISNTLQLLHMDLFGPTSVRSINHKTYCLVITDDFSRFSWTFFLRTKDETSAILKDFIRQIENQLNQKVKTIRCDNGTEFKNRDIIEFCGLKGIKREYSNARTPQQNGVAERKNRTLIEAARTMLADSFLPNTFWAEAVSTACYVLNRVLVTKPHNKTPYELLTGKTPIISYIRPFGCHVTILNTIDHLGKFAGKSDEGFLVGYSLQSKAFRVYNLVTKRVEENLHINFLENKPNVAGKGPNWLFDLDYLTDSMNYHSVRSENQANLHAGQQESNQNTGTKDKIGAGDSEKEVETDQDCFELPIWHSYSSTKKGGPREEEQIFLDDLARLQRQEKEANEEAEALRKNLEQESENLLELTVQINHSQEDDSELPPFEIFHEVLLIVSYTSSYDDEGAVADFHKFGNSCAWLTNIKKIVACFEIQKVWILVDLPYGKKAIGTKWVYRNKKDERGVVVRNKARLVVQGHRQEEIMKKYNESHHRVSKILSIHRKSTKWLKLCMGYIKLQEHEVLCDEFEALMKSRFQMSSMGELTFFLGLQVKQKPDVCSCSLFQVTPKTSHLSVVKRIFRYLKGKPKLGLWYPRESSFDLESYSDSDYAGANLDRKSTTGGCQFLGRRLITWQCKKQTIVATSTTEAEYVAAASCCGQVLWIQNQMLDYGFNFMNTKELHDKKITICIVKNPVYHSKTKHIAIRHHFIRDAYEKKLIQVLKIHTNDNVADLLTKAFDVSRFQFLVVSIGMINP